MAKTRSVLMSKRRSGPSAKRLLDESILAEKCSAKDCKNPVLLTKNLPHAVKRRYCSEHIRELPAAEIAARYTADQLLAKIWNR